MTKESEVLVIGMITSFVATAASPTIWSRGTESREMVRDTLRMRAKATQLIHLE
jgi:hypothetical protein